MLKLFCVVLCSFRQVICLNSSLIDKHRLMINLGNSLVYPSILLITFVSINRAKAAANGQVHRLWTKYRELSYWAKMPVFLKVLKYC